MIPCCITYKGVLLFFFRFLKLNLTLPQLKNSEKSVKIVIKLTFIIFNLIFFNQRYDIINQHTFIDYCS